MTQGSVVSLYDYIFGFQKIFDFLKWEYHDRQMKHVSGHWSLPTNQITKVDLSDLYSSEFTSYCIGIQLMVDEVEENLEADENKSFLSYSRRHTASPSITRTLLLVRFSPPRSILRSA